MGDKVKVTTSDGEVIEVDRDDLIPDNPDFFDVFEEQIHGAKERVVDENGNLYILRKKD